MEILYLSAMPVPRGFPPIHPPSPPPPPPAYLLDTMRTATAIEVTTMKMTISKATTIESATTMTKMTTTTTAGLHHNYSTSVLVLLAPWTRCRRFCRHNRHNRQSRRRFRRRRISSPIVVSQLQSVLPLRHQQLQKRPPLHLDLYRQWTFYCMRFSSIANPVCAEGAVESPLPSLCHSCRLWHYILVAANLPKALKVLSNLL